MTTTKPGLTETELRTLDGYWRAANYLSVGQIYLMANALLAEPLRTEHIKPRLLGHWGTSPGLNMLCVHLNRVIKKDDLNVIYIIGPGHGGPSLVAHAYLGSHGVLPLGGGAVAAPGLPGSCHPRRRRRRVPGTDATGWRAARPPGAEPARLTPRGWRARGDAPFDLQRNTDISLRVWWYAGQM